jgi:hypothetical protein
LYENTKNTHFTYLTLLRLLIKLFRIGLHFWDYGNAFLLEARRAGADVTKRNADGQQDDKGIQFRYDSYVQKIMGYDDKRIFITAVLCRLSSIISVVFQCTISVQQKV